MLNKNYTFTFNYSFYKHLQNILNVPFALLKNIFICIIYLTIPQYCKTVYLSCSHLFVLFICQHYCAILFTSAAIPIYLYYFSVFLYP